jgi:LSD1 subclass zinc finger protein
MDASTVCTRCETPLEQGDLRCAICGQATPAREPVARETRVQQLRCAGCGAALGYDPGGQAPRCAFCGEVLHVETMEDPPERIDAYLPFTVGGDAARACLAAWFRTLGFFRPRDLATEARLQTLQPLWWVGWVFDAEAFVSWAGDSNFGAHRSAWAPHSGQTPLIYDNILVSASRGLALDETTALTETYDLGSAGRAPAGVEHGRVEQFDVQRSLARQKIVEAIDRIAVSQVTARFCPGTRHRNMHVSTLLRRLTTRRFAFPAWVMAYRYHDRLYRAVVSGQRADAIHAHAPISWGRVGAVVAGGAAVVGGIIAAVSLAC